MLEFTNCIVNVSRVGNFCKNLYNHYYAFKCVILVSDSFYTFFSTKREIVLDNIRKIETNIYDEFYTSYNQNK